MKKLLAWSMALLCMASLAGCAERTIDRQSAATQGDGDASEFDTYTVTANYDYGMHRPGLAAILYNSSTAFFELPEGVDMVLAGDLFTVKYSGQLLIQESYPSSVVFADGGIESLTMQKAKLVRLTYHPAADGEAERFVVLHDNGIEEEIAVAERPDYYITDAEGHFEPLGELDYSQMLFGSYSPVDGYSASDGYKFSGFYVWNPRFEEREVHPDTLAAVNELNENADFAFDLLAKRDDCDFTGYTHEAGFGCDEYEREGQTFRLSIYPDLAGGDACITNIACTDGSKVFGLDGSEDIDTIRAVLEEKGYTLETVGTSPVASKYGVWITFSGEEGAVQLRIGVNPTNDTGIVY